MFTIQAGVTRVTAAILKNWLNLDFGFITCSLIILTLCMGLILFIKKQLFDSFVKILVLTLIVSTLISLFVTFDIDKKRVQDLNHQNDVNQGFQNEEELEQTKRNHELYRQRGQIFKTSKQVI